MFHQLKCVHILQQTNGIYQAPLYIAFCAAEFAYGLQSSDC